ncbi:MAG: ABC transporter permease [Gammaproteobacteria bacterium]|nr:ABC transporter permease [Gammaproteobacteria bacterium]
MNTTWSIFLKEVIDNLRDRRTLLTALVFGPLFGPLVFSLMIKFVIDRELDEGSQPIPVIALGAEHAPELLSQLAMAGADIKLAEQGAAPETILADSREQAVLVIPAAFQQQLDAGKRARLEIWTDGAERKSRQRGDRLSTLLEGWGREQVALRMVARGIAPELLQPLLLDERDVSTAASRSTLVFAMLPYFVLLAGILGCFYLAIDATAGERERGSLEPLLCLPVSRGSLVLGKVMAAFVFSLASLALSLGMFALAMPMIGLEAIGMDASLSAAQLAFIMLAVAPFGFFAAGMLTLVASFAKSYKEAQTYLSIVMLVPLVPVIISSIASGDLTRGTALVPGLSQHLIILESIKGTDISWLLLAFSGGSTLLLGALLTGAAVWIYRSERILG